MSTLLHDRFFRFCEAETQLEKVAIYSQSGEYTYRDVLTRVEQVAGSLEARGVIKGDIVALRAGRDFDAIASIYAIMSLGAVYLPIDSKLPKERVGYMLKTSGCRWLLTDQSAELDGVEVLEINKCNGPKKSYLFNEISSEDLAYIIFTSGSTGRPKGVMITHRSSSALISFSLERFGAEDMACVFVATSFSFDISIFELFTPLACGGSLCLADSIMDIVDHPHRENVSLINTVPSAMSPILAVTDLPKSVRSFIFGGEPLNGRLARKIYEQGVDRVFNLYGPTEVTIYSTEHLVKRDVGDEVPIGKTIKGIDFEILDEYLEPVKEGEYGELCLFGIGLALGYIGQPNLTEQSFLTCPSGRLSGQLMYRTGDRVKLLPDGNLYCAGRLDDQVKLYGYRIELREIESVINAVSGVVQASVQVKDLSGKRDGSRNGLVAYFTWSSDSHSLAETLDSIKAQIASHLPSYMSPLHYVNIEAFPLTINGKLDKKSLPEPISFITEKSDDLVRSLFNEVLGIADIPENETLFDLGGVSLDLVRIVANLRVTSGKAIMLKEAFSAPSISGLKNLLSNADSLAATEDIPDKFLVEAAQRQMWISMQMANEQAAYRLLVEVRTNGVSAEALEEAFRCVIKHHVSLHTEIALDGTELRRKVLSQITQAIYRIDDFRGLRDDCHSHLIDKHRKSGCPLTAVIAQEGNNTRALVIVDHTSFDHWSLGVLKNHLELALLGEELPEESKILREPLVSTEYERFMLTSAESLAKTESVSLKSGYNSSAFKSNGLALVVTNPLPSKIVDTVKYIASTASISQVGVMLGAFADVVSLHTGATDFSVGIALADRYPGNYESIDCKVNTLPIVISIESNVAQVDRFKRLGGSLFDLVTYSHLGIKPILEQARIIRGDPNLRPFTIAFGAHNAHGSVQQSQIEASFLPNPVSRLDLTLWIDEQPGKLVAVWSGNSSIFSEKTLEEWHEDFISRLEVIAHLTEIELATKLHEPLGSS